MGRSECPSGRSLLPVQWSDLMQLSVLKWLFRRYLGTRATALSAQLTLGITILNVRPRCRRGFTKLISHLSLPRFQADVLGFMMLGDTQWRISGDVIVHYNATDANVTVHLNPFLCRTSFNGLEASAVWLPFVRVSAPSYNDGSFNKGFYSLLKSGDS